MSILYRRTKIIQSTNPIAGAEFSLTVPDRRIWKPLALSAVLVTDATIINRRPSLVFDNGTDIFARIAAGTVNSESGTYRWSWIRGTTAMEDNEGKVSVCPLPSDLIMLPGYRIRSLTNGIQAGDDWGVATLLVVETVAY
jgi:hypothetical protein